MNADQTIADRPKSLSYFFVVLVFVVVAWLHLATPLLAALFSYLALQRLRLSPRPWGKWLAVMLFLIVLTGITYALGYFIDQAIEALPQVAEKAIPSILKWAQTQGIELPFTDYESLKALAFETLRKQATLLPRLAGFAKGTTTQVVFLMVGCVVAVSLFMNAQFELEREAHRVQNNLYSLLGDEIGVRFGTLYRSFDTVMGAQLVIATINAALTSVFTLVVGMPHPVVIIGVTFCCGLLPVVGNLVSNMIIVAIGFTVSPQLALVALVFLVVIHKLEYFLNSKIVGARIRNPVWLTLLGLVLGEELMGLQGMILAPVVLHYLKQEMAAIEVKSGAGAPAGTAPAEPPKV